MEDRECVEFLQWAVPQLEMRWQGFRRVRRQVCKRIQRRMRTLQIEDVTTYRRYLEAESSEWRVMDEMCRVVVSRFYRDRKVFDTLYHEVLPRQIALTRSRGRDRLRIWSIGCASGEEAYSLALCWYFLPDEVRAGVELELLATDSDGRLLQRAARACYAWGTVKMLPQAWREKVFRADGDHFCLSETVKRMVDFRLHDVRSEFGFGKFDIVLCRNLVFTYYMEARQMAALTKIGDILYPEGVLIIGAREQLPARQSIFYASDYRGIYYKDH